MSSSRSTTAQWPAQTSLAPLSHSGKRKRSGADVRPRMSRLARATIVNQTQIDEAVNQCFDSDFSVISCWPTNETVVDQSQGSAFVWNSRLPSFTQFNLVDIALFRADTGSIVRTWNNQTNPSNRAGNLPVIAEDEWWGSDGPSWDGTPTSFPFYFAVVASGTSVAAGQPQPTFTAVQTTFPASIIASMSSASASAAASSSAMSATLTSQGGLTSSTSSVTGGSVQDASNDSPFPRWAIAVIVILGFLALAALVALIFLVIARSRRRRYDPSRRGSMGSQSPMMANVQRTGPLSPPLETGEAGAALGAGTVLGAVVAGGPASVAPENDGASSTSENLFSGADAAVMAEAFRKALRKPEFADQPVEEGESPEAIPDHPELLSRELAEEGRDIRSVGSSRGVRVETLSDGADTATATRHSTPRNSTG